MKFRLFDPLTRLHFEVGPNRHVLVYRRHLVAGSGLEDAGLVGNLRRGERGARFVRYNPAQLSSVRVVSLNQLFVHLVMRDHGVDCKILFNECVEGNY